MLHQQLLDKAEESERKTETDLINHHILQTKAFLNNSKTISTSNLAYNTDLRVKTLQTKNSKLKIALKSHKYLQHESEYVPIDEEIDDY